MFNFRIAAVGLVVLVSTPSYADDQDLRRLLERAEKIEKAAPSLEKDTPLERVPAEKDQSRTSSSSGQARASKQLDEVRKDEALRELRDR